MSRSLAAGLYPDAPGTHQVFGNAAQGPGQPAGDCRGPRAVVVPASARKASCARSTSCYTVRQARDRLGAAAGRERERRAGRVRARGHADRQRRHRHHAPAVGAADRAGRARGQPERLHDSGWPQVGHLHPGRALPRSRERGLARAAGAGDGGAGPAQGRRRRCSRGAGALRRPLDASYRGADYDFISASTGAPAERRADDRLHARHQARAHRGARAGDAGARWSRELVAKRVERRQPATRRSAARCSSCWCRSRWSRSSAARPRW